MKNLLLLTILLVLGTVSCDQAVNTDDLEKTIKFEKPSESEPRYKYISFEVPQNTDSISIVHSYDKKGGKNRLEFGLFDPNFSGENTDKKGLRGWSGSVRDRVFIAKESATHGYATGEIKPGTWHVIFGLASVADDGVEVKVNIKFDQIDDKAKQQYDEENQRTFSYKQNEKVERVRKGDITWFAGDLHAHTFHGDGRWSVKGILESAKSNNLDFVALTEHNTFSHHKEIEKVSKEFSDILVLNGQEVTTYGGHINVWGLPKGEWIDFRVSPNKEESAKLIANEAEKFGAIASVNHPTMDCGGCNWTYGSWENLASVEIWNATWDEQDESALKEWDKLLQKGKRITAIGSSDSHQRPEEPSEYPTNLAIGEPTVFIGAREKTQKSIFEAIKRGRVFVAENSRRSLEFTANEKSTMGEILQLGSAGKVDLRISASGFSKDTKVKLISNRKVIEEFAIGSGTFSKKSSVSVADSNYFRLEFRDPENKMLAFTNPIYVQVKD